MISYAQNREDALLGRAFGEQAAGFYIDVGANDPVLDSMTRHFYDRGWRGINIEPGEAYLRLAAERPRDVNLNVAISNRLGEATFFEVADSGLSTVSPAEAQVRRQEGRLIGERRVNLQTLASICAAHVSGPIDFISIDVEGHEREVIEGGDWRRWRPRVAVVESTRPNSTVPSHQTWEPLLLAADYEFAVFDGLNRFYVRAEDRPLIAALRRPLSVHDDVIPYWHVREVRRLEARLGELEAELADVRRTNPLAYLLGRAIHRSRRWLSRRSAIPVQSTAGA